jgi:glycine hydroxymethyltransferase
MVSSGLRIGTPALATRGFGEPEFREVADIIAQALKAERLGDDRAAELRARVAKLADAFPLYSRILNGEAA